MKPTRESEAEILGELLLVLTFALWQSPTAR